MQLDESGRGMINAGGKIETVVHDWELGREGALSSCLLGWGKKGGCCDSNVRNSLLTPRGSKFS